MAESIKDLLPHASPMILLDGVIAHQEDFIHTVVTIHKDSPFFEKAGVPSYVALEYMAQAIGVWNGFRDRLEKRMPQIGYLLGSRQLTLEIPFFQEGAELHVYGEPKYVDEELASFECWIEDQGKRVAHGSINVFQPKKRN